jgi:KipI family sensor histidine kinase inhibitor
MQPLGDRGLLLTFGGTIDEAGFHAVRKANFALTHPFIEGVIETILGYTTLLLAYDPETVSHASLAEIVRSRLQEMASLELPEPRTVTIPVAYGGDFGPDIDFVARHNGLTPKEVIALHTAGRYPVYMLGFTPGFPYLGGLSEKLWTPRLETPRTHVPAGSVGIANNQTGIYPVDSPGGWQLIGRTPLKLFDPGREDPFLVHPGEIVIFQAITAEEYHRLEREDHP